MKKRRRQNSARAAGRECVVEMLDLTCSTRRDHWNTHRIGNRASQFNIVTLARAVAIHAGQKDFTGSEFFGGHGPFNRIASDTLPATMRVNFPTAAFFASARIDRDDDALAAKRLGTSADQLRIFEGRSVERDLVGACTQYCANVLD